MTVQTMLGKATTITITTDCLQHQHWIPCPTCKAQVNLTPALPDFTKIVNSNEASTITTPSHTIPLSITPCSDKTVLASYVAISNDGFTLKLVYSDKPITPFSVT
jgi:hypothetical protein